MQVLSDDDVVRISMLVLCDAPDEDDVRLIRAIEAKILEKIDQQNHKEQPCSS